MSAQINVSQKNHHMALVYIWNVFLPSLFIHVFSAAAELYDFDDDKDENKLDFKKLVTDNWIEPTSRRERKRNYSESDYFKQALRQGAPAKPREPRIPRMPHL
jgi:hypothetical protein